MCLRNSLTFWELKSLSSQESDEKIDATPCLSIKYEATVAAS